MPSSGYLDGERVKFTVVPAISLGVHFNKNLQLFLTGEAKSGDTRAVDYVGYDVDTKSVAINAKYIFGRNVIRPYLQAGVGVSKIEVDGYNGLASSVVSNDKLSRTDIHHVLDSGASKTQAFGRMEVGFSYFVEDSVAIDIFARYQLNNKVKLKVKTERYNLTKEYQREVKDDTTTPITYTEWEQTSVSRGDIYSCTSFYVCIKSPIANTFCYS